MFISRLGKYVRWAKYILHATCMDFGLGLSPPVRWSVGFRASHILSVTMYGLIFTAERWQSTWNASLVARVVFLGSISPVITPILDSFTGHWKRACLHWFLETQNNKICGNLRFSTAAVCGSKTDAILHGLSVLYSVPWFERKVTPN